jgi:hypothetical protein
MKFRYNISIQWMNLLQKFFHASLLLMLAASCFNAAQLTPTSVPTSTALPSVISTQTLQVLPSVTPTLEVSNTPMPEQNVLDPQGTPLEKWRGIPIMPEAIAGQEFGSAYSFKTTVTSQEVQEFYRETLTALGWDQPVDDVFDVKGGKMVFRKQGSSLAINIIFVEDSVVVLLAMVLA